MGLRDLNIIERIEECKKYILMFETILKGYKKKLERLLKEKEKEDGKFNRGLRG